ncbi:hypothetical protein [Pseudoalteromonas mariniglutinosa]|uniref:hypothetical protein n=1 Tax=Pseudoalteromonas mariniglutinosa TaxID=206042 RepID=UPI00384D281E
MSFTSIMFACHSKAKTPVDNVLQANNDMAIIDFSGTEALTFLAANLGLDVNKLMTRGLGIKSSLDDDLNSRFAFAVYYFSETAFRFVLSSEASLQLQALMNEQQLRYDIDYVLRDDLSVATLSGQHAFDTLIECFKLTPGLRLSDQQSCYGTQSGDVFITAIEHQLEQQFQLIAKAPELTKWQVHLQQRGFTLSLAEVA